MRRGTKVTLLVLVLAVTGIVAALVREAGRGPSFRAGDYDSLAECLRHIPADWLEGSIERTGAETACRHLHAPPLAPR
jgi:hypothetical protein